MESGTERSWGGWGEKKEGGRFNSAISECQGEERKGQLTGWIEQPWANRQSGLFLRVFSSFAAA